MRKGIIFIVVALLLMLSAVPVYAGVPELPHAFYGVVEINGIPAPIGSTISATGDGVNTDTIQNPVETTKLGSYGIDSLKLLVQGNIPDEATITFYVNDIPANETVVWHSGLCGETTRLDLTVPETAPSVDTSAATSITTTSATLNGNLSNLGTALSAEVSFEWGTTTAYGNIATAASLSQAGAFSAALSGLSSDTTYYFKAKAVGHGTTYGIDRTFTTTALAPPGVGVGVGAPPAGTTDVRGRVTLEGVFTRSVTATSEDELCTLTIPRGTVGLTEELEPLDEITMVIMDEPPDPPKDANVVGLAYDFGPDGATFDRPITLIWKYDPGDIPKDVAEEDLVIAMWDEDVWNEETDEWGVWVVLEGCVVDTKNKTITASVSHFTTFAVIARVPVPVAVPPVPVPAAFSVSNLTIQPLEVESKEAVTITVSVANTGGTKGSYSVVLKINGVKEAEKSVTIAAGGSQDVSFTVTREEVDSYSVTVDGLSASFTVVVPAPVVVPPPAKPPAPPPIKWPLLGGIIAAVIVVGLGIFFLIRRKAA